MPEDTNKNDSSIPITPLPTIQQEEFITTHKHTDFAHEAHPISEKFVDRLDRVGVTHFALAAIQAVADTTTILEDSDDASLVEETEQNKYYQVNSTLFYRLCIQVKEQYENSYVSLEQLSDVVELHTRQFLFDLHGFDEAFNRRPTLCDAMNNNSVSEGAITIDDTTDGRNYGFADGRGLVIEKDTHED